MFIFFLEFLFLIFFFLSFLFLFVLKFQDIGDIDINMLTMEQYMALTQGNNRPGVVRPEIDNNVNFEISIQFIRELRHKLFTGKNDEDAHLHVRRVLEIADLFHTPGVTHDALMLRVFPITLTGAARRWFDRLSRGTINTKLSDYC